MGGNKTKTIEQYRVTEHAYNTAKLRAKGEGISISKWVSKAIIEKALLDEIIEETEDINK